MKISCPNYSCPSYGKRKQWYKKNCGHYARLDTDLDVYCGANKCKWKNGRTYVKIHKLKWNCNNCKVHKHDLETISASLNKISSALIKSMAKGTASDKDKDFLDVLSTILDKIAEEIIKNRK